jgi:hypothetical protein
MMLFPHLDISHDGSRLIVQELNANLSYSASGTSTAHHCLNSSKLGATRIFIL